MEMRFYGPEGSAGLGCDLGQRALGEESQSHDLSVGFIEGGHGGAHDRGPLGTKGRCGGIAGPGRCRDVGHLDGIDPAHGSPAGGTSDGEPDGDSGKPGAERAIATPRRQRPIAGHEGLLDDVFGLVKVAEHAVTGPNKARTFAFDDRPERLPIPAEHGIDEGAVIMQTLLRRSGDGCVAGDRWPPVSGSGRDVPGDAAHDRGDGRHPRRAIRLVADGPPVRIRRSVVVRT